MAVICSFETGELNVGRLNYAMLTLIPKEPDAKSLKKFRPISLLNCTLKIITRVLTMRLNVVCDRIIAPN